MIRVNDRKKFLSFVYYEYLYVDSICAEIGVLNGDFSEMIYDQFMPIEFVLVDPFINEGRKYNGMDISTAYSGEREYNNIIKRFYGRHTVVVNRKYSHDAVGDYPDKYFDFIYHDASHLYEDIKRDLNDWLPKLKEGGIMAGHDYINFQDFGVIQAVNEFCKEHDFEMIIFNANGGDYALRAIQ